MSITDDQGRVAQTCTIVQPGILQLERWADGVEFALKGHLDAFPIRGVSIGLLGPSTLGEWFLNTARAKTRITPFARLVTDTRAA